ncbi:unnamed protein product [Arctia plantaginis]|uniref:Uncharacterized protein n=1 Tax=Arctia plantaginis TaxID=874455 RepID=A0A8S0ZHE1_ARCPL|nr:unnamed protein product [Arctia plantaginis]
MDIPKSVILLCCVYYGFASHESHTIPVEDYETELHNLGEHVEIPETPVRIIKITKTVAVKVPVPYPVKVIQKVPYPVHISKPYPVPVPQIVKVPHVESPKTLPAHEPFGSQDSKLHQFHDQPGDYQVQEHHSQDGSTNGESYEPQIHSYSEGHSRKSQQLVPYGDDYASEGAPGNSFGDTHNYYGNTGGHDVDSLDSKNYDDAIKNYLHNVNSYSNAGHSLQNHH